MCVNCVRAGRVCVTDVFIVWFSLCVLIVCFNCVCVDCVCVVLIVCGVDCKC